MKIKIILSLALAVLSINEASSQDQKLAKADKLYKNYAYIDAIKTYENIAAKGHKSVDLFQKLGNAYYFNSEFEKANKWYTELFLLNQDVEPEYYYRYSQTSKSVGDYKKADEMLSKFIAKNATDERGKLFKSNRDYLQDIKNNSGRYAIENAGINSEESDYGTAFSNGKLVFASSRQSGISKKVDKWTNQSFTNLYVATVKNDGTLDTPEKFSTDIDSKFHEATPAFAKDGKTMYFTRNNYLNGKKQTNSDKIVLLKIYKATLEDGKWSNVTELPFNSNDFNTAHPALSPDDKTLYFASNRPGTIGQSDLYKVAINPDGTFREPQNLGKGINTEGKETFPFISDDNELYFSSDGHPGLGGLDVFKSKIEGNEFLQPQNVGEPVNGTQDDFAFVIDVESQFGFFSSNREGGQGYDDIYKFKENKKLECEQLLAGIVTDSEDGSILKDVKVTLFDKDFKMIKESYTDNEGMYSFEVECGKKYYVRAEKIEYETKEQSIVILEESGKTDLPIVLDKKIKEVPEKGDILKAFAIKEILFDLDKSNIRPDAAIDIEKIIDVMKQYPSMIVDIRSHTDSRASRKYNEALSERRAKATLEYMVSQGIDRSRLTAKGYGETQLLNKCADGVKCSEEEHQANRRSEFIIIKL